MSWYPLNYGELKKRGLLEVKKAYKIVVDKEGNYWINITQGETNGKDTSTS